MISKFAADFAESDLLQTFNSTIDILEDSDLFSIYYQKCLINKNKRNFLKNKKNFEKIYVLSYYSNYHNTHNSIDSREVTNISDEDFISSNFDLNDSLVILTNNNLAKIGPVNFINYIQQFESAVVVIHDFDNHHWHHLSVTCALAADVYIPAHLSSNIIQSRLNPNINFSIPCGTIQWSRELLFNNLREIINTDRIKNPLGMHNFYSKFKYRNSVINTLEKNINSKNFNIRSDTERFHEWTSHSCHWIIPVYNDLPIRFFDALITGGIPIIPSSLVQQLDHFKIPTHFYVTHDALDIFDPSEIIQKANSLFANNGVEGILERFEYCLSNFHVNAATFQIIEYCENKYLKSK